MLILVVAALIFLTVVSFVDFLDEEATALFFVGADSVVLLTDFVFDSSQPIVFGWSSQYASSSNPSAHERHWAVRALQHGRDKADVDGFAGA